MDRLADRRRRSWSDCDKRRTTACGLSEWAIPVCGVCHLPSPDSLTAFDRTVLVTVRQAFLKWICKHGLLAEYAYEGLEEYAEGSAGGLSLYWPEAARRSCSEGAFVRADWLRERFMNECAGMSLETLPSTGIDGDFCVRSVGPSPSASPRLPPQRRPVTLHACQPASC